MRDRLLAALRAMGGVGDPAALLVRAGVVAERPAAGLAAELVGAALEGDARVEVQRGMVRFVGLHAAPAFAVVAIETVQTTAGTELVSVAAVRVGGPEADRVEDSFELRVRPRGKALPGAPAVARALASRSPSVRAGRTGGGKRTAPRPRGAGARWRAAGADAWDGWDAAPADEGGAPAFPDDEGGAPAFPGDEGGAPASSDDGAGETRGLDAGDAPANELALRLERWLEGTVLAAHPLAPVVRRLVDLGVALPPERLCLRELARRVVPGLRAGRLDALCAALEIDPPRPGRAGEAARAAADALVELGRRARDGGLVRAGPADLPELSRGPRPVAAPERAARVLAARLEEAPEAPGVYRFLDEEGNTVYVGASEDLRRRLAGHLGPGAAEHSRRIVARAHDVVWETCPSALEAFLREAELLAAGLPALNRRGAALGDAVYLRVTKGRAGSPPRLRAARRPAARGRTFGPFTFAAGTRRALATLSAVFAGAEDRLERFLERGDPALAPRPCPEVVEIARARAAVRGAWNAGTRAVRLPGGTLLLLHGDVEADLVRAPTAEKALALLRERKPSRARTPPDHLDHGRAARASIVHRWAAALPQARLDELPDLAAVRRAIAALLSETD